MKWLLIVFVLQGQDKMLVELEPAKNLHDCARWGRLAMMHTEADGFVCEGPKGQRLECPGAWCNSPDTAGPFKR